MTISIQNQRVIYADNGALLDRSVAVNSHDDTAGLSFDYVASEDYLYIGSELPFNHKYFALDPDNVNTEASSVSVDIWFSNGWVPADDVIDRTEVAGASLAQSGVIQWSTNRLKGWDREMDSEDVEGLSGTVIYDKYWIRVSFNADLTAGTTISYVGYKFADDDDLYDEYPDLNNATIKSRFANGKTDWNDQHYLAAKDIIKDLKAKNIIKSPSQLVDFEVFRSASVHKTAEIIYFGMGETQADKRRTARKRYSEALDQKYFRIDGNADGNLSTRERFEPMGFMSR